MSAPVARSCVAKELTPGAPDPPLTTMGTLPCDPAPRLTPVALGRRTTECQIPETGLRRTCGVAPLENGRWARGPWWWDPSLLQCPPLGCLECVGAWLEEAVSRPLCFPEPQFSFPQYGCECGIPVGP